MGERKWGAAWKCREGMDCVGERKLLQYTKDFKLIGRKERAKI